MRALLVTLTVVALAAPTFAHTPKNCAPLFREAARESDKTTKFSERVVNAGLDMLESRSGSPYDRYRRYSSNRVETYADLVSQFLGHLAARDLAVAEAVKCVDGRK